LTAANHAGKDRQQPAALNAQNLTAKTLTRNTAPNAMQNLKRLITFVHNETSCSNWQFMLAVKQLAHSTKDGWVKRDDAAKLSSVTSNQGIIRQMTSRLKLCGLIEVTQFGRYNTHVRLTDAAEKLIARAYQLVSEIQLPC
jgi:hypothetical protein